MSATGQGYCPNSFGMAHRKWRASTKKTDAPLTTMGPRHPIRTRLVHLIQYRLAKAPIFAFGPPRRCQLRHACCKRICRRNHPLCATNGSAGNRVECIEPMDRLVRLVLLPEALFRFAHGGLAMGSRVAQNREQELHKRFVRRIVGSPDDVQNAVELLLGLGFADKVSLPHGCRLVMQIASWRYRAGKVVVVVDATSPPLRMASGTGDITCPMYWTL